MQVGDVVLVHEDTWRFSWPLARVLEVYPSADGTVRSVLLRIKRRSELGKEGKTVVLRRPVTKVSMIEPAPEQCEVQRDESEVELSDDSGPSETDGEHGCEPELSPYDEDVTEQELQPEERLQTEVGPDKETDNDTEPEKEKGKRKHPKTELELLEECGAPLEGKRRRRDAS